MRQLPHWAITIAVAVVAVGCQDTKNEGGEPQKSSKPVMDSQAETVEAMPESCTKYVAAMEKLKSCETLDAGLKANFVRIYDGDQDVVTGKRASPRGVLSQLCGSRLQNVASVLASQCGAPLAERGLYELRAELDKTLMAIEVADSMAHRGDWEDSVRAAARRDLVRLEKEKTTLEALIAEKESQKP